MVRKYDLDDVIRGLVMAFSKENPDVKLAAIFQDGSYIIKLDYSFTQLSHDAQARGRADMNKLMKNIHSLGVSTWLELGEV